MIVHTDEPRTPLHLYNKLLTERAYDELDGSPVNELFNCTFINVNDIDDPLVDRVNDCAVTVPRNYPTVFVPPSTPIAKRTPKTQYHQPAPGSTPPRVQYLHYTDSATESEDGDSVLWPETYLQGTYC